MWCCRRGQGSDGGDGYPAAPQYYCGGGGGGKSSVGTSGGANVAGDGGNGQSYSISGTSVAYAGGGGGRCQGSWTDTGTGGTGGGGSSGISGTANTGGGGGDRGNGGSGVVIIRYLTDQLFDSLYADLSGNVGIGTTSPSYPLDIVGETNSTQILLSNVETDATGKNVRIAARHYTNSEEPLSIIAANTNASTNEIYIGGGGPNFNAATRILFYTAANTTTTTGTEAMRINSSGYVGIGTTSPGRKLDILDSSNPQLRLSQATGVFGEFQLDSSGNLTYVSTGNQLYLTSKTVTAQEFSGSGASLTSIPESAVTDGSLLARVGSAETISANWNFTAEPSLSGAGRHARKMQFNAEYAGAVLSSFYGGGTDTSITGTLTSDAEPSADNLRTYYEWTSSESSLNYYTVAVRVTLPSDFDAWVADNAIQVDIDTESTDAANNAVGAYIYNGDDTPATAVATSAGNKSNSADAWATVTIDDSAIDDGSAPDWDAPGETAVIYLRVGSKDDNFVRIGDIKLNYLSKW